MSKSNAALSLPPGDRDEAMPDEPSPALPGETHSAGRTPELPTLLLLRQIMEGRLLSFVEIELALKREDWPAADAAAFRFRDACMHDMRILSARLHKEIQDHRRSLLERRPEHSS